MFRAPFCILAHDLSPRARLRAMNAGLLADTYLEVLDLEQQKKSFASYELTEDELDKVDDLAHDPRIMDRLSGSLAPEIFGHEDVKKALLLQLVGAVTRKLGDGVRLRGDINVCLMGDPGECTSTPPSW